MLFIEKNLSLGLIIIFLLLTAKLTAQQEKLDDSEITNSIETELMMHEDVPSNMIDVATEDGVVTLTGSTSNILAKERAEDIALAVRGVKDVIDRIVVVTADRPDQELKNDIQAEINSDPATASYKVNVDVDQNNVTLSGSVNSWHQKQLAAYKASQVRGVKKITNKITIEGGEERTDEQIKQEVVSILKNDARVDQAMINVRVDEQVVYLSGTVGSATEKRQAIILAHTGGVGKVNADDLKVSLWARDSNLRQYKYEQKTDEEIKSAIQNALTYEPRVEKDNIEIQVKNKKVTLKGNVLSLKAKQAAENTAKNVVGVGSITNLIKVRPEIPGNPELEQNVKAALLRHPDIERFDIMVDVINGMVYLTGQVDSYYERNKAEDIAAGIYGVTGVSNNLQVRDYNLVQERGYYPEYVDWSIIYPSQYTVPLHTPPVDDNNIASSIRNQLWWSPFVNEDEITVEVDNGVAVLSGEVATISEKRAATKNAWEGGASKVINRIKVVLPDE